MEPMIDVLLRTVDRLLMVQGTDPATVAETDKMFIAVEHVEIAVMNLTPEEDPVTLCLSTNPQDSEMRCDKPSPCYGFHANALAGVSWPGNPLPQRPEPTQGRGKARKADLAMIAQRAQR